MTEEQRLKKLNERQWEGVEKFIKAGARATLEWATGIGKTHAFLKVYGRFRKKYETEQINIVVPTEILVRAYQGHIKEHKLKNVEIFTINTYIKTSHKAVLTVFDEIHKVLGETAILFSQAIELTDSDFILGLTASLTKEERQILVDKGVPVVDTITFKEAVKEQFISDVIIFNLGVDFNQEEQIVYDKWDRLHTNKQRFFQNDAGYFDYKLMQACCSATDKAIEAAIRLGWDLNMGVDHEYSPKNIKIHANICAKGMIMRMQTIFNARAKIQACIDIINKFNTLKTIVFSERTSVVEELIEVFGKDVASEYHSNMKNCVVFNDEIIARDVSKTEWEKIAKANPFAQKLSGKALKNASITAFEKGKTRILLSSRAVDAGYDLPGIELGIVHSGNSTVRQNTQRGGRTARYVLDKIAIIVNIYMRNSQEVKWLKARQKEVLNVHWIQDINDIGTTAPRKADFAINTPNRGGFNFKINI